MFKKYSFVMNGNEQNTHRNLLLSALTIVGDVLICLLLYTAFCRSCGYCATPAFAPTTVIVTVIYFACVYSGGVILYKRNVRDFQVPMLVLRNVLLFTVACLLLLPLGGFSLLPLKQSALFIVSQVVAASAYRLAIRRFVKLYRTKDSHKHHAVLVGSKENIRALYDEMTSVPYFGYEVEGYFDYSPNPDFPPSCPYLGAPQLVTSWLRDHREVHELYCCLPSSHKDDILPIIRYCQNNVVHFYSVPNVSNYLHHRMYLNVMGSVPYLSIMRDPLERPENRLIKRLFDVVVSLLFLCTLFPVILVIVTVVTKLTMPGPVFFRQKRNGINGREFYCIKFRSMRVNADADRLQATKDDPRKTKWGNIMRKTNIDELPQFVNVLLGDMSIVGPRPHMLKHTEEYSKLIDNYMVRHFVKPGITGWSQVTGFRGETKELAQMEGRVRGDIYYIEHWSLWLDLYIMYKTEANALKGDKEAY